MSNTTEYKRFEERPETQLLLDKSLFNSNINNNVNNNDKKKDKNNEKYKTNIYGIEVDNFDDFLQNLYYYYKNKGYRNIITKNVTDILSLLFTMFISSVVFFFNWDSLHKCDLESFSCKNINIFSFQTNIFSKVLFTIYISLFIVYTIWFIFGCTYTIKKTNFIKKFYNNYLQINDEELLFINWNFILEKIDKLQENYNFIEGKRIYTRHDKLMIIQRIMRRDNVIIGLIENNILTDNKSKFLHNIIYSKILEWNLRLAFINNLNSVNKTELLNEINLKNKFILLGIFNVIIMPFSIMYNFIYFILDNVVHFHTEPKDFMNRTWTNYGFNYLRYYNELPHICNQRLYLALKDAVSFTSQFKNIEYDTVNRFFIFIIGSVTSFMILLGIYNEALLTITIFDRNLWWYIAIFTALIGIFKNNLGNPYFNQNPNIYLDKLKDNLGYKIDDMIEKMDLYSINNRINIYLKYKLICLLYELISVIITPYILLFIIPNKVSNLCDYLKNNLEKDKDLGYILKDSKFNNDTISISKKFKQSAINFNKYYNIGIENV